MTSLGWVICVGCGTKQLPLIRAIKSLGYSVIGVDKNPSSPLIDRAIGISTYDSSAVLKKFHQMKSSVQIQSVVCRSSGPAIKTAYLLAELYQRPSPGLIVTSCSLSKYSLSRWAEKLDVPTIPTLRLRPKDQLVTAWDQIVIKPAEPVFGKKNVYRVSSKTNFTHEVSLCSEESLDGYAVVQPYIPGLDLGVAVMTQAGKILWTTMYSEHNSFFLKGITSVGVSTIDQSISDVVQKQAIESTQRIVEASYSTGFVFLSFRVSREKTMLYEVNPGLCGDKIVEELFSITHPGIDFFNVEASLLCGQLPSFLGGMD